MKRSKARHPNEVCIATESYCFYADGHNFSWQLGVAYYMQKRMLYSKKAVFTGYKSGLLVATALACEFPIKKLFQLICEKSEKQRRENICINPFKEEDPAFLEELMLGVLAKKPRAWRFANKRLAIPVQSINGIHYWITEFASNNDIMNAFKASTLNSVIRVEYLNAKRSEHSIAVTSMKKFPLLDPMTIIITCRKKVNSMRFVKYAAINNIEIMKASVPPQTSFSYCIPSCPSLMQRQIRAGARDAREYFAEH
jgi:hypothetical protein